MEVSSLTTPIKAEKVAIMQPYFFPYLGYFALIKHTDFFVSFDPVQYIRKGWINRNRVLKPNESWQYITAPIQGTDREALIKDVLVTEGDAWKTQILRQLEHYKKRSPYYAEVKALLERCFANPELSISRLNTFYLAQVCEYLEIPFNHAVFSDMNLELGPVTAPDEWALRTSQAMGATTYINPPGGREFFNAEKYEQGE
ncbi:WbqC family protein [Hymenobacter cellulosilyticus]|uniref:WbqC family protein n=1 Tax=Hymenobacter cellulosilyticus TaxID=2932248 RepID=A0A8T9QF26_9BACT|nr:WbqC family protein [Hymenobacter cellulosilyticus]UOQ74420.1 WbqC family protein [Hymenobacter cellulosilyticus]